MAGESQSRPGVIVRLRHWRERRKQAAKDRRTWSEDRIAQERHRYKGPGAPGA